MLAHNDLIDRFAATRRVFTSDAEELDNSDVSRTEIAKAGLRIALNCPLGCGCRGTAVPSSTQTDRLLFGIDGDRAAHNHFC